MHKTWEAVKAGKLQATTDAGRAELQRGYEEATEKSRLGFIRLGTSSSGKTAADVDEMLADGFGRDEE